MGARLGDLESGEDFKLGSDFMEEGYRVFRGEKCEAHGVSPYKNGAGANADLAASKCGSVGCEKGLRSKDLSYNG